VARIRQPYKSLLHTLQKIKSQAFEGIDYMRENMPAGIYRPSELFNLLKDTVTYKHDPKGVELIHTPRSFYTDNYWKKSGYGDCDDFTVITIAGLKAIGVPESKIKIKLTGRQPYIAKHIYIVVDNTPFDLTNGYYGEERQYPYYQEIPLNKL
jgi:hypothetical protein